ncbi:hypothetical protein JTB14_033126 [Gonioctena quinquepunctata]|nr:hypothetical protein JTB14_033126 [Gonioctena quinquepunctata]
MGTIEKVYTFFNTPKRQQVLQHQVHSLLPESRSGKLKQMCPTRWIQRHDSVMIMVQLLKPVHAALQEISLWKDKDSSSAEKLLGYSLPLAKILQLENPDLAFAMDKAEETISTIKYVRKMLKRSSKIFSMKPNRSLICLTLISKSQDWPQSKQIELWIIIEN